MSKKGATAIVCRNGLFFLLKSIRFGTLFWSYYNKISITYCLFNVWLIIYFSLLIAYLSKNCWFGGMAYLILSVFYLLPKKILFINSFRVVKLIIYIF